MTDSAVLITRDLLDAAENQAAKADLFWHTQPDSLEAYAAFQAALAGWKKAAELYWDARREDKKR